MTTNANHHRHTNIVTVTHCTTYSALYVTPVFETKPHPQSSYVRIDFLTHEHPGYRAGIRMNHTHNN